MVTVGKNCFTINVDELTVKTASFPALSKTLALKRILSPSEKKGSSSNPKTAPTTTLSIETVALPAVYIPAEIESVSPKSVYATSFSEPIINICPFCNETSLSSKSTRISTLEFVLFQ